MDLPRISTASVKGLPPRLKPAVTGAATTMALSSSGRATTSTAVGTTAVSDTSAMAGSSTTVASASGAWELDTLLGGRDPPRRQHRYERMQRPHAETTMTARKKLQIAPLPPSSAPKHRSPRPEVSSVGS